MIAGARPGGAHAQGSSMTHIPSATVTSGPGAVTLRMHTGRQSGGGVRGEVRSVSSGSLRRFAVASAQTDFASWAARIEGGCGVPMITLTYPADWLRSCPDAATLQRHMDAWLARLGRATRQKVSTVWVREFQRRGAPHIHVMICVPTFVGGLPVAEWVSRSWWDVVGSGDADHLAAGTNVRYRHDGSSDIGACIRYLCGYLGAATKGHQRTPPPEWADRSIGRTWGIRGLPRLTVTNEIDTVDALRVRRIMRGLDRSRRRVRRVRIRRVDHSTGVIRYRYARRRITVRSLRGASGATIFARRGFAVGDQILAAIGATATDPTIWPPPERQKKNEINTSI
jgi:hypothetical protein